MNYVAKCIAMLTIIVFGLNGCGGESSGESSGTMTTAFSCSDFTTLSAQAATGCSIYVDPTYACSSCHGLQGEGTNAGGPINNLQDCPSCAAHATLTTYNDFLMPASPYSPSACGGVCASDVSQFIIEGYIEGKAIPGANNNPAINVNPNSGLSTSEDGAMASFTVRLATQPTADVMIGLSSSTPTEGAVSSASLTFNAANWNQLQTVTVTGVDDGVVDGNVSYTIVTATAASADTDYNGMNAADVAVVNTDNDGAIPAGITINPISGLITGEDGTTATFMVSLDSMPTADVTIPISSSNANEGTVSTASLTFTMNDYNLAQTVTITGVDDVLADGNVAYMVVTGAATSADAAYNNLNASDVSVTNMDNEVAVDPDLLAGQVEYKKVINGHSCETCHGPNGLGPDEGAPYKKIAGFQAGNLANIVFYLEIAMPKVENGLGGMPSDCVDAVNNCATNVAKYMENGYTAQ